MKSPNNLREILPHIIEDLDQKISRHTVNAWVGAIYGTASLLGSLIAAWGMQNKPLSFVCILLCALLLSHLARALDERRAAKSAKEELQRVLADLLHLPDVQTGELAELAWEKEETPAKEDAA